MNKRDKWIQKHADRLNLRGAAGIKSIIEDAIRLGLDNADNEELKEDTYTITLCTISYDIYKNNTYLGKIFFGMGETDTTKEQAYKVALALIKSLQEEENSE